MSEIVHSYLNSIVLIILSAVLTFGMARYWHTRERAEKLAGRVTELESKLALVNQAIIPISTAFQAILIKELTHFHTPEMDALMVKIGPPNTLTVADSDRLAVLLRERALDMGPLISDSERDAALILPPVMKRALIEAQTILDTEALKPKIVMIAAVVGVDTPKVEGE